MVVELDRQPGYWSFLAAQQVDPNVPNAGERLFDRREHCCPAASVFGVVAGGVAAKRGQQTGDLLAANLHRAAEPLVRDAIELSFRQESTLVPRLGADVHVLVL